jgi:hypothetical protein
VGYLNIPGFVDTVGSTTPVLIGSLTMIVPAAGFITVTGSAEVFLLHDQGTTSRLVVGLSTAPDELPDSTSAVTSLPGTYPAELYVFRTSTEGVFEVTGPGSFHVYFTANKGAQPRAPSLHDLRIVATYLPRHY